MLYFVSAPSYAVCTFGYIVCFVRENYVNILKVLHWHNIVHQEACSVPA